MTAAATLGKAVVHGFNVLGAYLAAVVEPVERLVVQRQHVRFDGLVCPGSLTWPHGLGHVFAGLAVPREGHDLGLSATGQVPEFLVLDEGGEVGPAREFGGRVHRRGGGAELSPLNRAHPLVRPAGRRRNRAPERQEVSGPVGVSKPTRACAPDHVTPER
ncbi:hypothetical protein JHN46_30955 [Streptomyces sp. MBT33]|nr:hypothetical protein [Streptomyces sp. MBT33]